MKRSSNRFMVASLVIGAIFCASLFSFSDEGKKGGVEKDRVIMMKEKLGLSDDQVAKIKAIFADSKKINEPLKKQVDADIKSLKDKVKAGASDKDLKPLLDTLQADHQKIMDARKSEMDQVKAVLTPSQQAKDIIAMNDRKEKWKDKDKKDHEEEDGDDE